MSKIKQIIGLLNNEIIKHYSNSDSDCFESSNSNEEENKEDREHIEIPYEYYITKVLNNIQPKAKRSLFKSTNMKRLHNNFSIIIRLLCEESKSPEYVAKWLHMSPSTFIKCIK